MLSCALDDDGRRVQRARYTRLAASVAHLERTPEAVVIEFDEQVHRETLERALAVERQCCPFFIFDFDPPTRRLDRLTASSAPGRGTYPARHTLCRP